MHAKQYLHFNSFKINNREVIKKLAFITPVRLRHVTVPNQEKSLRYFQSMFELAREYLLERLQSTNLLVERTD
jgi:hypothetical protein